MMQQTELHPRIASLLVSMTRHAEAMVNLLRREHELLSSASPEELRKLADEKQQLAVSMSEDGTCFQQLMGEDGVKSGSDPLDWLKQLNPSAQFEQQWNNLAGLLADCKKQNEINGAIVQLGERRVNHALDILRGSDQSHTSYGRTGVSNTHHPSSSLGTA
jgi:flagellar biosynthesis/type III secretory pathway chaperone